MAQNPHIPIRSRLHRALPFLLAGFLLSGGGCTDSPRQSPRAVAPHVAQAKHAAENPIEFLTDYRQAIDTAQRENRVIMLFFTAPWCHYCHEMEAEALSDPVIRELARQFTCVRVDADREGKLCEQYQVSAFPTVQFVSPRGTPLSRMIGKQPAEQLARHMQGILGAVAQRRAGSAVVR